MPSYRDQQPPPPPPPGGGGYDSYRSSSSYRDYPPPPPGPRWDDRDPPRDDRYDRRNDHNSGPRHGNSFRGPYSDLRQQRSSNDSHRGPRDEFRPPQGDFTFRVDPPRPSYVSGEGDSYIPSHRQGRDRDQRRGNDRRRGDARQRGRGRPYRSRKAADRDFLHKRHDENAQLILSNSTGQATFRDIDNLTDSDEAEMDISGESGSEAGEPAAKRARTGPGDRGKADDGNDAPKWSNPDPYTALPPPDETTRKKIDMVQLIRKARIDAGPKESTMPSDAMDFISCDFSEDDDETGSTGKPKKGSKSAQQTNGIPTGPKSQQPPSQPRDETNSLSSGAAPSSKTSLPPRPPPPAAPSSAPSSKRPVSKVDFTTPLSTADSSVSNLSASTSLGNRKRTHDDKIKLPHASLKKAPKMRAEGYIVPDWEEGPGENPCPWTMTDHSATTNMGTRLHKEIMDFYNFVRPRDFEQKIRQEMIDKLTKVVQGRFRDANVFPFGSFMSGLYLPTADMDIAICSDSLVHKGRADYGKSQLFQLRAMLQKNRIAWRGEVELILHAKVPLVKYTDNLTALKVDISVEKLDGHKAIRTFLQWKEKYPAMPILVAIVKQFLLMRGLNEPVNGGIGGFSVICLVVNLLNQMPQIQSGSMVAEHHLGEVLMEFFELYGNRFRFDTVAIRMNPPGFVNKSQVSDVTYRNLDRFSILDPNNPQNDIAGGSANTPTIVAHFSKAAKALRERMAHLARPGVPKGAGPDSSLLGCILGGKYSTFQEQRDYLRSLPTGPLGDYPAYPPKRPPHPSEVRW